MANLTTTALDEDVQWERQESFAGGEDSFRRATLIEADQCQQILNIVVKDNYFARTRAGADALGGSAVAAGQVYGLKYFDTPSKEQLLASIPSGTTAKFWKYESGAWTDLSASWHPQTSDDRLAMAQGVDKMLISDGEGHLQTWDGSNFADCGANATTDPPIGSTILCWHTGRMFASGVGSSYDTIWVSNRLSFGSGQWNTTTRSFRVGKGDGDKIVSLISLPSFVLLVLKENSVRLIVTDPVNDADNFSDTTTDNDDVLSDGIGCVGRDAWCHYGNDVLFMAQDGVRSVQRMQAATGQWQLSAPLSQPIQPYIDRINKSAWSKICAKKYREFAFFFVPLDDSATNNYVLVWNGRLGKWLGAWTNWTGQFVEVTRFSGINRLVFGDITGRVNMWKDTESITTDTTYLDNSVGYPSKVWTRAFLFGDAIANKSGYTSQVRFDSGNANLTLTWVADNAAVKDWQATTGATGDILGVDVLPFLLASSQPVTVVQPIRGLSEWNEAYIRIESATGWFTLKNISVAAHINPIRES
jgi:hypothetical protein